MFIYKGTKVGCIVNDSGPCHFSILVYVHVV